MKYASFKAEDFYQDADFIRWVVSPTEESNQFWNTFLANYPDQSKEIQIATQYIKTLYFQEIDPSTQDLANLKTRIWNDLEKPALVVRWYRRPAYWAAAAAVLLLVSFGAIWWNQQPALYETAYGEIQKIDLPDGSVVTLNAHSTLKVAANLEDEAVREVWLEGEAYFDIVKFNNAKFIVHTPEAEIEVLGTEFNVNTRRKKTKVILHEGKVKLSAENAAPVILKSGDMATVADTNKPIELKKVEPKRYDYWRDSVIVLDDRTVSEIMEILQDNYGITIQLADSLLLDKKLTGKLSLNPTEEFVENFATILDATVEKTENGYFIKEY